MLTAQATGDADSGFNWLLFTICAAGGMVAAAVTWGAGAIVRSQQLLHGGQQPPSP